MIKKLASGLPSGTILLNSVCRTVVQQGESATVQFSSSINSTSDEVMQSLSSKWVVLALPPRVLLSLIEISPPLAIRKVLAMLRTPTWMEDTMKVAMHFKSPFWQEQGLSGHVTSAIGPISQMWDNS